MWEKRIARRPFLARAELGGASRDAFRLIFYMGWATRPLQNPHDMLAKAALDAQSAGQHLGKRFSPCRAETLAPPDFGALARPPPAVENTRAKRRTQIDQQYGSFAMPEPPPRFLGPCTRPYKSCNGGQFNALSWKSWRSEKHQLRAGTSNPTRQHLPSPASPRERNQPSDGGQALYNGGPPIMSAVQRANTPHQL